VEKKRETIGVLTFKDRLFLAGDSSKFKVTKVENIVNHDYNVTIAFNGFRIVGTTQVSISAEVGKSIIYNANWLLTRYWLYYVA